MDKKVYEKTRYQNIYRHKKNKNYVIMMSKPVKTSISRVNKKKIMSVEDAIKVRDNVALKKQKATETLNKETFDELWSKYMFNCKNVKKLAYKTLKKKDDIYNKYLKNKIQLLLSKTTKEYWSNFIEKCDCTKKHKNEILKQLKAFMTWCIEEEYIVNNPLIKIHKYKVTKPEMKYWLPEELSKFLDVVNQDINSVILNIQRKAYLVKIITLLGFALGDRIGESRALTFKDIDEEKSTINILHSINYDFNSKESVKETKTYYSQRDIIVTEKLIEEIKEYKRFLIEKMHYNVDNNNHIIFNYNSNKPYWDSTLRKHFNYYIEKAQVTKIRMYDLRHTYVATMMSEGMELYQISKNLGHTSFSTTVNEYGHLSNKLRKEIAKVTDKYY